MLRKKQTAYFIILFLPTSITLWWYGVLGSFSRMMADDFCSFFYAERLGLLRSLWYWRLTWSGRYSAYAADWLVYKTLGAHGIQLIVPLSLLIWLLFIIVTIYLTLHSEIHSPQKLLISILLGSLFLFVVLTLSPAIPQSLYWFNGMRSYSLPLIVLTFYAILFQLRSRILKFRFGAWVGALLAFLLLFGSGGLSETFAVMQLVLMVFLIARKWLMENPKQPDVDLSLFISGLLGALTSLLVIITAPGNAIRQTEGLPPPGLVDLVLISLQAYGNIIYNILASPEKITALLGAVLAAVWMGMRYGESLTQQLKKIILYLVGALILSFVCFPPGVFGYNEPPPLRIVIIPIYMLIAGTLSAGFLAGNLAVMKTPLTGKGEMFLILPAILCIGFSAWITTRFLYQSRQIYTEFAEKWDTVDAKIQQTRDDGGEVIYIPDMSNWADLDPPNTNPNFWATECYSFYYGIQVFGPP